MTPTEWGAIASVLDADAMKSQDAGWYQWRNGSDDRGFSVVPGGKRKYSGIFSNVTTDAFYWPADETLSSESNGLFLHYNITTMTSVALSKVEGYSLRCTHN